MALVEGFGDEVLILAAVLTVLLILYIAWVSTGVTEIPRINVVLLSRDRFRHVLANLSSLPGVSVVRTSFGYIIGHNQAAQTAVGQSQNSSSTDTPAAVQNVITNAVENTNSSNTGTTNSETTSSNTTDSNSASSNITNSNEINSETVNSETSVPVASENTNSDTQIVESENITDSRTQSEPQPIDSNVESENIIETENIVESDISHISSSEPLSSDLLRKRRLEFLQKNSSTESRQTVESEHNKTEAQNTETITQSTDTSTQNTEQLTDNETNATETPQNTAESGPSESRPATNLETEPEREEGKIRIKIVFLDQRQKYVQSRPEDTIATFKRTHFAAELAENYNVRLIHSGQEMKLDNHTLQSYRIKDTSVVHVILRQVAQQEHQTDTPMVNEFDVGSLLLPIFGLILALLWYCRFTYRSYFNATSTLSLIGITFVFGLSALASLRWREEDHLHHD